MRFISVSQAHAGTFLNAVPKHKPFRLHVACSDGEAGHATRHFLINTSIYDALRRVYGGQLLREPDNYHGYSDHRPDLALLVEGTLKVFDLKVFDPISSVPGQTGLRGAYVGFGNTAEPAADAKDLQQKSGNGMAGGHDAHCR